MQILWTAARALLYATGFVTVSLYLALLVRNWDAQVPVLGAAQHIGMLLMASGLLMGGSSIAAFVAVGKGTPAPFDAPRRFVAVGPYRVVRNPMYVGGLTALAGLAIYLGSGAMLLFAILWAAFAHLFVVLYEEPVLRTKFGREYVAYCAAVPRWLPWR
ncbi:MAG: isoprenylcysteine carboxylmethyltransferase family protein [Bryobacterales bacterium]|nr:isoprenylcysteine carboxylmethyltransferase family protein [Bryobacterales bacterium]